MMLAPADPKLFGRKNRPQRNPVAALATVMLQVEDPAPPRQVLSPERLRSARRENRGLTFVLQDLQPTCLNGHSPAK